MGRNVHTTCLEVTEPEADDESTGDKEAYMASVLARYRKQLAERTKHHLGYPYNLDFDYGALGQLQHFSINNLGDPFIESNYGVHSRQFEVGVLDWFARLWEIEKNDYWGYITNCGTEGNLHGILLGREVFPDGILYASKESHYSVFKAARMYRMDCEKVGTLITGEIDCADLKAKLLPNKDKPAILNVNIGTTVKGAVDDLDLVIQTLEECGYSHDRFYIHCDGALFGLMMPFVKKLWPPQQHQPPPLPSRNSSLTHSNPNTPIPSDSPPPPSAAASPPSPTAISVGDKLPDATLSYFDSSDELQTVSISDLTANKKTILIAVPGAFTPTCSQKHLPGFVEKAAEFKSKGVDSIACISVNDAFVMKAWKENLKIGDDVLLLSDGNGDFTRAIGCELDLSDKPVGLGVRSRRYALYVEDGVVKISNLEEGGAFNVSSAEDLLKAI